MTNSDDPHLGALKWDNVKMLALLGLATALQAKGDLELTTAPPFDAMILKTSESKDWPPNIPFRTTRDGGHYFINPKYLAGVIFKRNHEFHWMSGIVHYQHCTWEIDGESIGSTNAEVGGDYFLRCPRLFGKESRTARVTTNIFDQDVTEAVFNLRLPGGDVPPPKLPSYKRSIDGWQIEARPRRWLCRLFPVRYDLSISDGKGSTFIVDTSSFQKYVASAARPAVLRPWSDLSDGQPNKAVRLTLRIDRLASTPMKFRIRKSYPFTELVGEDNVVYFKSPRAVGFDERAEGIAGIKFGEKATFWGATREPDFLGARNEWEYFRDLPEGASARGLVYRVAETKEVTIDFEAVKVDGYSGAERGIIFNRKRS